PNSPRWATGSPSNPPPNPKYTVPQRHPAPMLRRVAIACPLTLRHFPVSIPGRCAGPPWRRENGNRVRPGPRNFLDAVSSSVSMGWEPPTGVVDCCREHADQILQIPVAPPGERALAEFVCARRDFDGTFARAVRRFGYRQEGSQGVRAHAQSEG